LKVRHKYGAKRVDRLMVRADLERKQDSGAHRRAKEGASQQLK